MNEQTAPPSFLRDHETAARMLVTVELDRTSGAARGDGVRTYEVAAGEEIAVLRDPAASERVIEGFLEYFSGIPLAWISTDFLRLRLQQTTVQVRLKSPYVKPAPFEVRLNGFELSPDITAPEYIIKEHSFRSAEPGVLEFAELDGPRVARITMRAEPADDVRVGTEVPISSEALIIRKGWAAGKFRTGNYNVSLLADALDWLGRVQSQSVDPKTTEQALADDLMAYLTSAKFYTAEQVRSRTNSLFDGLLVWIAGDDALWTKRTPDVGRKEWNRALRRLKIAQIVTPTLPLIEQNDAEQSYRSRNTTLALLQLAMIIKKHSIVESDTWERLLTPFRAS